MGSKKVLIVEDEPTLNEMIVEEILSEGYEAVGLFNGQEALDYLEKNKVDFIVSDIKMPKVDGIELLKKVKQNNSDAPPFLVVTGFNDLLSEDKALELGAVGLITKPFKFDQLYLVLEKYL